MVALIVFAVVVSYAVSAATRGALPNPFNFFGFFTIQSNLLSIVVLTGAAVALLRGRELPEWFHLLRGCVTAYIAIVGVVYAILLAPLGAAGGVEVPVSNAILHMVTPLYLPLDWMLFRDRPALPWRTLWLVIAYPLVWVAVVLFRGATDGWVPYPFLNPSIGYPTVALYCLVILLVGLGFGALAWWASRLRTRGPPRLIPPDARQEMRARAPHSPGRRALPRRRWAHGPFPKGTPCAASTWCANTMPPPRPATFPA